MSRLFVIATGPLPEAGLHQLGGQCLRTMHFVAPLREAGHEILLATIPLPRRDLDAATMYEIDRKNYDGLEYWSLRNNDLKFLEWKLRELVTESSPDAIVGVNTLPAALACRLGLPLPIWADLNGWALAEGQISAMRENCDDRLLPFWRQERTIVLRADKFSTVSEPQEKALIGELALLGRLNRHSAAYTFAHPVPNAANPYFLNPPAPPSSESLRGKIVPKDAFVVLWSGGFNSWTDVASLHDGLCRAMNENSALHFVSTGGEIFGYDDKSYADFKSRVAAGPHRDRFHLLGWVAMELLPPYYREADLGLSVDGLNYETIFGARNRINNMMALGLPVATSRGTEISRILEKERLGLVFDPSDADALAHSLSGAFAMRDTLKSLGERARRFVLDQWSPQRTTKPLQVWAESPSLAPDNAERRRRAPDQPDLLRVAIHSAEQVERLIEQLGDGPSSAALSAELSRSKSLWGRFRRKFLP